MTVAIDLASKSVRASAATVIVFLALAWVWVATDGWTSSDGGSWLGVAGTTAPGFPSSDRQFFQQELQRALAESEARILNRTAAGLAAGAAATPDPKPTGEGLGSQDPSTTTTTTIGDVTRLLELVPAGSPESRRLSKLRYCHKFPDLGREPEQYLDAWEPSGKFLLPLCYSGQISNRLVCMQAYLLMAVLLNRTLIVPELETGRLGYMFSLVIDVAHARRCIGDEANRTVITLDEYRARIAGPGETNVKKVKVEVDRILCWKEDCASTALRHFIWGDKPSDVHFPATPVESLGHKVHSVQDLWNVYGTVPDRLITMGDLYGLRTLEGLPPALARKHSPTFPFRGMSCKLFFQPHRAIVQAAKGFVRTVLGPDFLAVHLRRGDFHGYWNREECTSTGDRNRLCRVRPIHIIARCIVEKARGTNISVVFAATNAVAVELKLLEDLLGASHPPLALVTLPRNLTEQPFRWARLWKRLRFDSQPLAFATLDKLVCAMSRIFMGTRGSTFSDDIAAMRADLATLTCQDQDLCAPFQYNSDPLPFFNETDEDSHYLFRRRK